MKPTVFIDIDSRVIDNPISRVLNLLVPAFGGVTVQQLVLEDVEADIVVTGSIGIALRTAKETKRTSIVLALFWQQELEEAKVLAEHYSDRITVVPYVGRDEHEMELGYFLKQLIADKSREVS